jgi:transposase
MRSQGQILAIGVESTGSFGATLTRALTKAEERVVEVNRPNRVARHMDGKSRVMRDGRPPGDLRHVVGSVT